MASFFGLLSIWFHLLSRLSCSSQVLSSVVFCAVFSEARIPNPPPLLFVLDLFAHLYPFIDIFPLSSASFL